VIGILTLGFQTGITLLIYTYTDQFKNTITPWGKGRRVSCVTAVLALVLIPSG
jgi:hypothetical protein